MHCVHRQYTAANEVAHDLLGEKGVPAARSAICAVNSVTDGSAPSKSVTNATVCESSVAQAQWPAHRETGSAGPRIRPMGDQHQRASLGNHGEKLGQQRFTGRVDPMCVLDDKNTRGFARQATVVLTNAVSRRRAASGSTWGSSTAGSRIPCIMKKMRSSGSGGREFGRHPLSRHLIVKLVDP